ncbi:DUF6978 family protein [Fontivita pretiosa]|uniref:DUF6978 family protein n=1 Tax=Fontivita pretiosa TaxID=2989684 RepID=UPI003D17D30B
MLTQAVGDALIAMPKRLDERRALNFPGPGEKASWNASSSDGRERFLMDVNRSQMKLLKCTYQERYRITEILVRLDLDGPPHCNPDGEMITGPHIHTYREGYADKWAMPLPEERFGDPTDLARTFREFLEFCNVQEVPAIQAGLQ